MKIATFKKLRVVFYNVKQLAEKCNLDLTDEQIEKLQIITQFNISARYDDYKENFKQKCTDEYTSEQVKNIEEGSIKKVTSI